MAYEDDKREFERIKKRCAMLVDRALFSFACSLVLFLAFLASKRFGQEWMAILLFLSMLSVLSVCFYFVIQQKRLRLRYYNLHYQVQLEEEKRQASGLFNRGDQ